MNLHQQDTIDTTAQQLAPLIDTSAAVLQPAFRFDDEETTVVSPLVPDSGAEDAEIRSAPLSGPGLFRNHELKPVNPNARPVTDNVSDWFTISLLALVVVFTWFRIFYYRIFQQIITAWYNVTASNQIVRDESLLLQRASLFISVISYMLAGLFLHQLSVIYKWQIDWMPKGIVRFVIFSAGVATAYTMKMILLRFFAVAFGQERPAALYIFNIFLMITMAGLLLLPVNIILAYAPGDVKVWLVPLSLACVAALFLYRIVRAVLIWTGIPGFSVFYLFLYLCTFEIAPLLVLWKLTTL
jgi:hypothetical protein